MTRKPPQDMLEFLRRQGGGDEPAEPESAAPAAPPARSEPEPTLRVVVLRRTQVAVACVAATLLAVLAFFVGSSAGARRVAPPGIPRTVHVIRAITFPDDEQGRADAARVASALAGLGQVTLHSVSTPRSVVVAVGAWLLDPKDDGAARGLLERVRQTEIAGKRDLASAYFWQIQR